MIKLLLLLLPITVFSQTTEFIKENVWNLEKSGYLYMSNGELKVSSTYRYWNGNPDIFNGDVLWMKFTKPNFDNLVFYPDQNYPSYYKAKTDSVTYYKKKGSTIIYTGCYYTDSVGVRRLKLKPVEVL